ncbi:hypothetical protein CALVIDRAFT_561478 [Calocera viscosa TUFC12733]|uniref:Uncharacterized protein n=1 Tax=Calocera viscosa (strain TUFC12733) TaxID=1330018 RepID=A0A167PS39_CALVF|nr:hypothetical protein CALVIDRAFT_561478 [Calocera viscosa TUFC12733]
MRSAALFLLASCIPALAQQCTGNDIRPDSLATSEVIFYDTDSGHDLVEDLFAALGTKIRWEGDGDGEVGWDEEKNKIVVRARSGYSQLAEMATAHPLTRAYRLH